MAKIALYRKYRPQDFSEVEGQEHIVKTLKNAVKSGAFSHAYIFCGPRGIGKTTIARIMAKAVNCKEADSRLRGNDKKDGGDDRKDDGNGDRSGGKDKWDGNPCNKCESCISINNQTALDIIEIDAASNRGIDEIRDLREKVKFTPSELSYKVFIIDEVHMLTREAFNALLKTLEEPPAHAIFIMATTEIHKIPATVISRCQRFDFQRIRKTELERRISEIAKSEKIKISKEAMSLIAGASEGGLRDAISIFDQISMNVKDGEISGKDASDILGFADMSKVREMAESIESGAKEEALESLEKMISAGTDIGQLTKTLMEHFRGEIKANLNGGDLAKFIYAVDTLADCNRNFKFSLYPQLALEVAIIKISGYGEQSSVPTEKKHGAKESPKTGERESAKPAEKAAMPERQSKPENQNISGKWSQVLYEIKLKNNSINAFVRESEPVFKKEEIELIFPYKFHKERIEDRKNREIVEKAVKKVCGRDYKIVCLLEARSGGKKKEPEPGPEDKPKTSEEDILNVLGGEVVG